MLNPALLTAFIPTFFFVSVTPGLCMTLAMTLGITVGVRRAFWMMWGEMLGVATVVVAAVAGIAALLLTMPELFSALRWAGGLYLMWLGVQMWRSRGRMAIPEDLDNARQASRWQLFLQGYVTAVANPKGWAFTIALLPPFLDASHPLIPQLLVLLVIILIIEFVCLLIYSGGGKMMRVFLLRATNVRVMNRIAGTLMLGVGVWLALF